MIELIVSEERTGEYETGIYVRAKRNGEWGSYDIGELTAASLIAWLRSGGGRNPIAEAVVMALLDHDPEQAQEEGTWKETPTN